MGGGVGSAAMGDVTSLPPAHGDASQSLSTLAFNSGAQYFPHLLRQLQIRRTHLVFQPPALVIAIPTIVRTYVYNAAVPSTFRLSTSPEMSRRAGPPGSADAVPVLVLNTRCPI